MVLDEGELAGVVIHPAGFFKEDVLLQVRFLGRSDDLALFAHLNEADLARLTPFHPGGDGVAGPAEHRSSPVQCARVIRRRMALPCSSSSTRAMGKSG